MTYTLGFIDEKYVFLRCVSIVRVMSVVQSGDRIVAICVGSDPWNKDME